MFKALHKVSGEEIIILEPRWQRELKTLRALDVQDILVCQGCLQPVRVRAGRIKRWHFAHKHLHNCPYETESPVLLQTRAVLYEWLVSRLGTEQLTLEKKLSLPRPVDCWVEKETGSIGYWIIDRRMPPDERATLLTELSADCTNPVWVFTATMFHPDAGNLERLYLTTTEREFMRHTVYDPPAQRTALSPGGSLHYLDVEHSHLLTFRGLQVYHPPQLYGGSSREHPLGQVSVDTQTGEFVHPGEAEQLERYQFAIAGRARQQQHNEQRIKHKLTELLGQVPKETDTHPSQEDTFTWKEAGKPEKDLPVCVFCGIKTDDYWYLNKADNTCKCRKCYREGKA